MKLEGKQILNIKELAEYLNCSVSCIRKLKDENKIPYFRVASKILFDRLTIENWIMEKQNRATE